MKKNVNDIAKDEICYKSKQLESAFETSNQQEFNPNLGELFRGSFWGEEGVILPPSPHPPSPCLKLVRIMLETSNLAGKYTSIYSFRKYTF